MSDKPRASHIIMDAELLRLLACPACKGPLESITGQAGPPGLRCPTCAVVYPVRNDIPVLLKEEAVSLSQWPPA